MLELNTLNIEFAAVVGSMGDDVWIQGDLVVQVDGVRPYAESDIVDADALFRGITTHGEHEIFSCCCGVPACSGWQKGIIAGIESGILSWKNPNNGATWRFDQRKAIDQYEDAKREAASVMTFFSSKGVQYVGFINSPADHIELAKQGDSVGHPDDRP